MPKKSFKSQALASFSKLDEKAQLYFDVLPELINNVTRPEPALAYSFQKIEMAQRNALYVLLMREYRTNGDLAQHAVNKIDITRSNFPQLYKSISGKNLNKELREIIKPAEAIRDRITHGRKCQSSDVFKAIKLCLDYAYSMNEEFSKSVGFKPFGPQTGATGMKGKPQHDKKVTKAILQGLGFLKAAEITVVPQE
ncbi:MAG: hypothetical protein ACK4IB_10300 [Erythrobacter sp.]